jgi:hypothetical protein
MKANKIIAVALAALTLVGFASCDKKDKDESKDSGTALALNPTSAQLEVGQTVTITATVGATWSSSNTAVATVAVGNDGGKSAIVTAIAKGSAVISATANGQTKTCVVAVREQGGGGGSQGASIDAKRIWPIVLDGITYDANASIVAGDIRPDPENGNNLDIWAAGETYTAGGGTGLNYFGNNEGYVSLIVAAPAGWSGGGFNIHKANSLQAMRDVKDAIVSNPDKMFLHIGMKATSNGNHEFYLFGTDATAFNIGTAAIEKGSVIGDFPRDGAWHGFDIPLAQFANSIAGVSITDAGLYVLSFLSGNTANSQLNLDAVYFYEKN